MAKFCHFLLLRFYHLIVLHYLHLHCVLSHIGVLLKQRAESVLILPYDLYISTAKHGLWHPVPPYLNHKLKGYFSRVHYHAIGVVYLLDLIHEKDIPSHIHFFNLFSGIRPRTGYYLCEFEE